ncbi:methyl-accepting chemotaxis protein [Rhizobium sp. C4]|uniref:methyl-accepting chemotaxis protein n=1 Tax=Rhizobium sp. C4 TaxID=1349800 RepID=UPI002E7BF302|nr:methyl-accepting chemotaxis protein [Rhizobium sp. C4]
MANAGADRMSRELTKTLSLAGLDDQKKAALRTIAEPLKQALPPALKSTHDAAAAFPDLAPIFADPKVREALWNSHLQRWSHVLEGRLEEVLQASLTGANAKGKSGVNPKYHIVGLGICLGKIVSSVVQQSFKPRGFLKSGADAEKVGEALDAVVRATFIDIGLLLELYAQRTEADQTEALAEQEQQSDHRGALFGAALSAIASRDLEHRINEDLPGVFGKMRDDFNQAAEQLGAAMADIDGSAANINAGADEISRATEDLARRTEQQAASIEETAAALEEITTTVNETAMRAEDAGKLVKSTQENAIQSGRVVEKAVDAMSEIERSSDEISNIIGVIDNIAFQTNLLALNAGVEAARAGDAGKGFAVVAQEVRELAQRSAAAAREIKALITKSSEQVKAGVQLVGETGKALETIMSQVSDINTNVVAIVDAAREQATGLKEINQSVSSLDQGTQQNAAMVEETSAASRALADEVARIANMTQSFRTGRRSEVSAGQTPRKPAVAKPAITMASPASHRQAAKPAPQRQQAALAKAFGGSAKPAEASWEEF